MPFRFNFHYHPLYTVTIPILVHLIADITSAFVPEVQLWFSLSVEAGSKHPFAVSQGWPTFGMETFQ